MATETLPLFPLRTVLFPGGVLPLRIFETRYLDMVRDCLRRDTGFGVCLILDGEEVGEPASAASFGCEARIVDFEQREDGLLGIIVDGRRRFHVETAVARSDGLLVGEVHWSPEEPRQTIAPEHGLIATLLERFLEKAGADYPREALQDAEWVAWRFAECLPLEPAQRLELLQLDAAAARLQWLIDHLPHFQEHDA